MERRGAVSWGGGWGGNLTLFGLLEEGNEIKGADEQEICAHNDESKLG